MDANSGANAGIILAVAAVLGIGYYVWMSLALARVFEKLGEQGWKAWVPVFNIITLLKEGGYSPLWVIAFFVPVVNVAGAVIAVLAMHGINRRLGKGTGFTVLAALAYPVWVSILGFDKSATTGLEPLAAVLGASQASVQSLLPPATAGDGAWFPPTAAAQAAPIRESVFSAPPPPAPPFPAASAPPAPAASVPPVASPPFATPNPFVAPQSPVVDHPPARPTAPTVAPSPWAPPPAVALAAPPATAPPATAFIGLPPQSVPPVGVPPVGPPPVGVPTVASAPPMAPAPPMPDFGVDVIPDPDDTIYADEDVEKTMISSRRLKPWILQTEDGQRVQLSAPVVLVGRNPSPSRTHPEAQLVSVTDPGKTVSKLHARLELADGAWTIIDLNSTNGVVLIDEAGAENELTEGVSTPLTERFLLGELPCQIQLEASR